MAYEILDISSFLTPVCQFFTDVLIAVVVVYYEFYDNVVSVRVSCHISRKLKEICIGLVGQRYFRERRSIKQRSLPAMTESAQQKGSSLG